MIATEIHVPVSLNEHFGVMSAMLVRSLARRANLPGPWRVVFTVSRDRSLPTDPAEHPDFAWARQYPVEFRVVPQELWDRHGYDGTCLGAMEGYPADVVLSIDADVVIAGSLADLVTGIAGSSALHARLAWQPPPVELRDVFSAAGLEWRDWGLTFSGYGIDFVSPKSCPPYFNCGFLAMPGVLATRIARTLQADLDFVSRSFPNPFAFQVALCLNIVRHELPFVALDERYNMGNGVWDGPRFTDSESLARRGQSLRAMGDPRVLHYCVSTDDFQKARDMASWSAVRAFCRRPGLADGQLLLQESLRDLLAE